MLIAECILYETATINAMKFPCSFAFQVKHLKLVPSFPVTFRFRWGLLDSFK